LKPIRDIIETVEARWYSALYAHCEKLFEGVFLPSHDHLHHDRVWSQARSLLLLLERAGLTIPELLPEQLIITVFFHDTGLTLTSGEEHGRESRLLCEEFFRNSEQSTPQPEKESYRSILHAIENHDDKSPKPSAQYNKIVPGLLKLLSTCDDMDAFGMMGIYRYAEIYLLRGIEPEQLPLKVSKNVRNRFENLKANFRELEEFIGVQESRFRQVYDFYLRLSQAFASRNEKPSWEPELIEMFHVSLLHRVNLLKPDRVISMTEFDPEIREWFNSLDAESRILVSGTGRII
jgi:hypothetical protein